MKPSLDPWTWLHDNDFSWDDVNAIAAILGAGGFEVVQRRLDPDPLYVPEPEPVPPPRNRLLLVLVVLGGIVIAVWWLR